VLTEERHRTRTRKTTAMVIAVVLGVGGWAVGTLATAPSASAAAYTIVDLGTLGGTTSTARAVNLNGQVVGWSATASGRNHAFLWQDGVMTDLGTLGGVESYAFDINDHGQVVGWSYTASGQSRAFLWQDGVMRDLGTLGGTFSRAMGINNHGAVAGSSTTRAGDQHAFRWANGMMTDIQRYDDTNYGEAFAINNHGSIVGETTYVDGNTYGFHWANDGTIKWLRPYAPGGDNAWAKDVDELNRTVVGAGWSPRTLTWEATMWSHQAGRWGIQRLPTPVDSGDATGIAIIDDLRVVVGYGHTTDYDERALLWENPDGEGFQMTDLGTLNGSDKSKAEDINAAGVVAGSSRVSVGGPEHAVIWRP
jgi:probable HAF family extracellular repeat protein